METTTDCRSEVGRTAGLVDAIMILSWSLSERDLGSEEVQEALKDLKSDENFNLLLKKLTEV